MLYGFSPAVVRVPDEGPRRRHTTGYWTLSPAADWTPPADLAAARDAGVPVTVVPFTMDQPFWGARVAEVGVGPEPIARRRLSRARLAAALRSSVADPGMRGRAAALGERLRAEDGVGEAVRRFGEVDVRRRPI